MAAATTWASGDIIGVYEQKGPHIFIFSRPRVLPYFNFFKNQKTRAKTMSSQPDQTTDPSSDQTNNESQATNPRQS
jgi:hypothetical protein